MLGANCSVSQFAECPGQVKPRPFDPAAGACVAKEKGGVAAAREVGNGRRRRASIRTLFSLHSQLCLGTKRFVASRIL